MEFLIIFIICIVACHSVGRYAERKGRSYWGFTLLSLLFLPLGVLAAVLAAPNEESVAENKHLIKCPYCAEFIKSEALICRFCHKELSVKTTPAMMGALSPIERTIEQLLSKGYSFDKSSSGWKVWTPSGDLANFDSDDALIEFASTIKI